MNRLAAGIFCPAKGLWRESTSAPNPMTAAVYKPEAEGAAEEAVAVYKPEPEALAAAAVAYKPEPGGVAAAKFQEEAAFATAAGKRALPDRDFEPAERAE